MEAAKGTAGRQYNLAIEFFMPDWSLTMYPMPAECGYTWQPMATFWVAKLYGEEELTTSIPTLYLSTDLSFLMPQ